jgi:hypothetical protein
MFKLARISILCLGLILGGNVFAGPRIVSFAPDGTLSWENDSTNGILQLQASFDLGLGWKTIFYAPATNQPGAVRFSSHTGTSRFFRLRLQSTPADESLRLHLPFENDLSTGLALDVSGHNNNGYRYNADLWPKPVAGINGLQAASFQSYASTDPLFPLGMGDYVAVLPSPDLDRLTNGTVMVWAHYQTNSYHNAALVDAGYSTRAGSWSLGRVSQMQTTLTLTRADSGQYKEISYPDVTGTNGDTGDWHHYCFTFNGSIIEGYFDGKKIGQAAQFPYYPELTLAGYFIGIGTRHHLGTPQWGDDPYPNNGWMIGKIDDVRIYNRYMTASEIGAIYNSFDVVAPAAPSVSVHANASTMAEIRWTASSDKFGLDTYVVQRDGVTIGQTSDLVFFDTNAAPGATYNYTVRARDVNGFVSQEQSPSSLTMPAAGSPVDIIIDDADNVPWIEEVGDWPTSTVLTGYAGVGYSFDNNAGKGTKSFAFRPVIPEAGSYKIYFRYPSHTSFEPAVPVDIEHAAGTNTVTVNERSNGNAWNLLGTFSLNVGTNAVVRVRNAGTTKTVVVDAVRFTK